MKLRLLGLLASLLLLLVAPMGVAGADPYTDQLTAKFGPGTHVVADPAARPPLSDPGGLNNQILATKRPIYVATVALDQTGVSTLDSVHTALNTRLGGFSGILLVIDARGYHIGAYGSIPANAKAMADDWMKSSAADHRNDPHGAVAELVQRANASWDVATSKAAPAAHKTDWTWLWILLGGFAVAFGLAVAFGIWRARRKRHAQEARRRVRIDKDLVALQAQLNDLDDAVLNGADITSVSMKAHNEYAAARDAAKAGRLDGAESHISNVQRYVQKAERVLDPTSTPRTTPPDHAALAAVPAENRKQASVQATNPRGQTVTINNNNYRTSAGGQYNHYYSGGQYNGMYFYPGYYPYAFWGGGWGWSPTDVLIADMLLEDRWDGDYDRGFDAGRDSMVDSSSSNDVGFSGQDQNDWADSSSQGDVGFDGSDQASDSVDSGSSGDVSFAGNSFSSPSSGVSYDPPSYDSGPSSSDSGYSGSDSGGGYDSGGGSDFGF